MDLILWWFLIESIGLSKVLHFSIVWIHFYRGKKKIEVCQEHITDVFNSRGENREMYTLALFEMANGSQKIFTVLLPLTMIVTVPTTFFLPTWKLLGYTTFFYYLLFTLLFYNCCKSYIFFFFGQIYGLKLQGRFC